MKPVELYARVRHACRVEGLSQREAARRFGIDPKTVAKMLRHSVPPGYRRTKPPPRPKTVIALGPSGTGKTHVALGLGLAACQKGLSVGFTTAAALVHELMEARDERRLLRLQKQLAAYRLLILDERGYVPLSPTGAELPFEVFSQRYERGSILVTGNLRFDEWTSVFGAERLTGALLDRLTHHVHILEMNGESYRLRHSTRRQDATTDQPPA
jgi:DNA replication protein DnaC